MGKICNISYIDNAKISNTEKERLEKEHISIFQKAKESKAFRREEGRFVTLKNNYPAATQFIKKINDEYKNIIATLPSIGKGKHSLKVNVLPLSKEKQGDIFFNLKPKSDVYTVWHSSDKKIDKFISENVEGYFSKVKKGSPKAVFFTANKPPQESFLSKREYQEQFAVEMKNPLIVDTKTGYSRDKESFKELVDRALLNNHDGVIVKNVDDNGFIGDVYISLNAEQINKIDSQIVKITENLDKFEEVVEEAPKEGEVISIDGIKYGVHYSQKQGIQLLKGENLLAIYEDGPDTAQDRINFLNKIVVYNLDPLDPNDDPIFDIPLTTLIKNGYDKVSDFYDFQKRKNAFGKYLTEEDDLAFQLKTDILPNKRIVNFESTLASNLLSEDIIYELAGSPDVILTGSLALSAQGTIYRDKEYGPHDLDFVVNNMTSQQADSFIKNKYSGAERIYDFTLPDYKVNTFIVPPKGYKIDSIVKSKGKVVYYNVKNNKGEVVGDYTLDTDGKEITNGVNAVIVDFFLNTKPRPFVKYEMTTASGKTREINLSSYLDTFRAKRQLNRPKDQIDEKNFNLLANKKTLAKMKEFLKAIGVDIKIVDNIVYNGKKIDANGAALLGQQLVQVVRGMESAALTEEAMHFAVEILERKGDPLFSKMLSEIGQYQTYRKTLADYSSTYTTPDGKPDIRKIKKEAIAKVLAEVIINKNEGKTEKPELIAKTESWWQKIVSFLKGLFSRSGFDEAAMKILSGESIGTAEDLRDETFLQQSENTQKSIIDKIKAVSNTIEKRDDGYYIDGRKVRQRVSDISKTWYENRFADKNLTKSEYSQAVDDLKAEKGTAGHADIEHMLKEHFLDSEGRVLPKTQRKDDSGYVSQMNPQDKDIYDLLKSNMERRLLSFPEGTVFLAETMVYDPKRDLAGTIDFIAVEPSGKIHLLDWKFMDLNTQRYQDVPWYKVGAWNTQMKNYKLILKNAYNFKFDGTEQTRMIPIKAKYTPGNVKLNILPKLEGIEIGDVEIKNEERAYLLPVGLPEERTGNKKIDNLVEKLNSVYQTLSEKKTTEEKKPQKAEQLNALYYAIRQLKVRQQIKPLVNQAKIINKEIRSIIDEFESKYKGKDLSTLSKEEANEFSGRIIAYEDSLEIYRSLYNDLKSVFSGELTEEEKTLKEDLRVTAEKANEYESELEEVRKEFAESVSKKYNILDFLSPDKVIKGFSRWFSSTSTLQSKAVQVLYKVANEAFTFAAMDTVDQANKLKEIKSKYDEWAKANGLTGKNYFDILKKKDKNELIDEFDPEFYKTLKSKIKDKDKDWVIDNVDNQAYKAHLEKRKQEEYKRIENKTRPVDDQDAAREVKFEKEEADKLYDISTPDSPGWLIYSEVSQFPKRETWETKEWKELHLPKNKPALEFYSYIRERNDHYQKIGYISTSRKFLPFVRKSLMEKLLVGGEIKVGEELLRNITVTEGDVGYGEINPITKEPIYRIPKYFTRDIGEQLSEDLFRNMTLLNEMAIRFEYLNQVEDTLRLVGRTEANKDAIKTSFFGKTKYKADGDIETTSDNTENSKLYNDMMEAIVYGHKYVESENFDQLLGSLGNFGKNLNAKLGHKVFPENFDNAQISLNKSITQLNNIFQIKTLGLNPISALSNFLGGSFQSYINAGTYFTKSEFAKNEFVIASRLNGVDSKKYVGALQYFLPLTENYNQILAKDLSLNKLNNEGIQDFLMILMRKSDQYVQTVNFFSYLDNTIVQDGRLLNAREYLRSTEKYQNIYNVSSAERKSLESQFEKDVKELLDQKGLFKVAKVEGNNFVIPGIDRKSPDVIELRRKVQSLTKDALGNLSEDDIRKINLNIYGKSFMIFKNWIPRLVDVRFGNLKYNAASDAYEWGRTRMMFRMLSEDLTGSISNLTSAIAGNDEKWVNQMKDLYQKKREEYLKDTGKELRMTEQQFVDLTRKNVQNQMTDVMFYLTLTMIFLGAKQLEPEDDKNRYVKNQYKFMLRVMDKVRDEIAYFYNPTSLANLTTSGIFPSLSYINNFQKLFVNFGKEMYAIGAGDEKAQDKNYVIKYLLKGFPITSQFDSILLMFYPDLAKDLGMKAQSESRPIGK